MTDISRWFLLHATSDCTSSVNYSSSGGEYSFFMWVTLGVVGFKLCTNAVQFYNFCVAWNLISQTHRVDLQVLHFSKKNFISRKILIDDALDTMMFRPERTDTAPSTSNEATLGVGAVTGVEGRRYRGGTEDIISITEANSIGSEHDSTMQRNDDASACGGSLAGEDATNIENRTESNSPRDARLGHFHSATSCPICLADFQPKEKISCCKDSTSCKHVFHTECLHMWLFKHESCPVCRFQIVPSATPPPLSVTLLAVPPRVSPVAAYQ